MAASAQPGKRDLTQAGKRLQIWTELDSRQKDRSHGDPLLLTSVEGDEALSTPFTYTVKMWRHIEYPQLDPAKLVNTPAMFSVMISEYKEEGLVPDGGDVRFSDKSAGAAENFWVTRSGVFETFDDRGLLQHQTDLIDGIFHEYEATIVPAFKMLNYETIFRVYEDKDVKQIIDDIKQDFRYYYLEIDDSGISEIDFPKMEYCVQFKETTYNFLSRLLTRFGIWYYFDHNRRPRLSVLVLGYGGNPAFPLCAASSDMYPNVGPPLKRLYFDEQGKTSPSGEYHGMTVTTTESSPLTINNFRTRYKPGPPVVRDGNFNELIPTAPFSGGSSMVKLRDLIIEPDKQGQPPPDDQNPYRSEDFPASFIGGNQKAKDFTEQLVKTLQPQLVTIDGSTRNPAFMPGYKFGLYLTTDPLRSGLSAGNLGELKEKETQITEGHADITEFTNTALDTTEHLQEKFLIIRVNLKGYERSYLHVRENTFWETIRHFILPQGSDNVGEVITNFTAAGLNNYLKQNFAYTYNRSGLPAGQPKTSSGFPTPWFLPFFLSGGFAGITSVVAALGLAVFGEKKPEPPKDDFHCSFNALQLSFDSSFNAIFFGTPPLPSEGTKPIAHGPHLAVVIDESKGALKPDGSFVTGICHDKLGRVRVRFPWDRKPFGKPFEDGDNSPRPQFTRGDNTCWVRVSQAWAGRGFGVQFLPRVGEEVIVEFIDGDPDRPIITGRVYNADSGVANLPFPADQEPPAVESDYLLKKPTRTTNKFTRSGIKTCTLQNNEAVPSKFHLLRFDDDSGHNQVLVRSQGRLDVTAFASRFESISSDRHLTVGGKKLTPPPKEIGGNYIAKVFKDYHLHVGDPEFPFQSGNRNTKLEGAESLSVGQSSSEAIGGDWSVSVGGGPTGGGQVSISALVGTGIISLSALTNITLMCGASSIVLTPAAISITSAAISLNGVVLGPPPVPGPTPIPPIPAIPAVPQLPQDPTPADPGDTLTPPKK